MLSFIVKYRYCIHCTNNNIPCKHWKQNVFHLYGKFWRLYIYVAKREPKLWYHMELERSLLLRIFYPTLLSFRNFRLAVTGGGESGLEEPGSLHKYKINICTRLLAQSSTARQGTIATKSQIGIIISMTTFTETSLRTTVSKCLPIDSPSSVNIKMFSQVRLSVL